MDKMIRLNCKIYLKYITLGREIGLKSRIIGIFKQERSMLNNEYKL